ncbi:Trafficking protein particle complex subunit 2 [Phlyctochytrium planicorne]|nr:Trafficking protein particle complex subunit 2 [Phlyctochytrium planicorne]
MSYFVIVGTRDNPLFEADFASSSRREDARREERHLSQFVAHASLDIIEETMWTTNGMYLKVVDRFNDTLVSAYVLASGVKFILLHDSINSEGIRSFFHEVHENFIKMVMNPFAEINAAITSAAFDSKVKAIAKRYL